MFPSTHFCQPPGSCLCICARLMGTGWAQYRAMWLRLYRVHTNTWCEDGNYFKAEGYKESGDTVGRENGAESTGSTRWKAKF